VLFGAHCSGGVKSAVDKATEMGADAVQLFVQSPRAWRFPAHDPADLAAFRERRAAAGLGAAIVHAVYLVNLGSPDDTVYEKSVATVRSTVETACTLGADAVVLHIGSHLGAGLEAGLERALPALEQALELCSETTWLLVENSAGAGGTIGRSISELTLVVDRLERHPRLGICLDSCHLFVSGYDITDRRALDRMLAEFDADIGLDRLRLLHVNDAQAPLGSNRDRHANIGEGLIGDGLGVFLAHRKLQHLPAVLEVPGTNGRGPDANEIRKLKDLHARWTKRSSKRPAKASAPRRRRTTDSA
jgi:deoxyribonuclease-4